VVATLRSSAVLKALSGVLNAEDLKEALTGVDVIGDIAIIKIPKCYEKRKHEIGECILGRLAGVRSIFSQNSPTSPGDRVRGIEWLAGDDRIVTTYSEHGCKFKVDVSRVYFSPRLSFERHRIASLTRQGEIVVNMFAGVGTFSIIMAKAAGASKVYSIDKNPDAFSLMLENVAINKVDGRVIPLLGDAKDFGQKLAGIADRVLMPLPELAIEYLPVAFSFMKQKGHIHIYLHERGNTKKDAIDAGIGKLRAKLERLMKINKIEGRAVRSVGRRLYQLAVDIDLEKGA
jgi:tRNA (guanine37-N1)-methyltransferase